MNKTFEDLYKTMQPVLSMVPQSMHAQVKGLLHTFFLAGMNEGLVQAGEIAVGYANGFVSDVHPLQSKKRSEGAMAVANEINQQLSKSIKSMQ